MPVLLAPVSHFVSRSNFFGHVLRQQLVFARQRLFMNRRRGSTFISPLRCVFSEFGGRVAVPKPECEAPALTTNCVHVHMDVNLYNQHSIRLLASMGTMAIKWLLAIVQQEALVLAT